MGSRCSAGRVAPGRTPGTSGVRGASCVRQLSHVGVIDLMGSCLLIPLALASAHGVHDLGPPCSQLTYQHVVKATLESGGMRCFESPHPISSWNNGINSNYWNGERFDAQVLGGSCGCVCEQGRQTNQLPSLSPLQERDTRSSTSAGRQSHPCPSMPDTSACMLWPPPRLEYKPPVTVRRRS